MVYWRAWINLSRYIQIYDGFPVVSYGFILFFCWWVEQFGDRDSRGSHGLARCRNSGACCQHHQSWACRELKLQDASTRATRWKSRCVIKQKTERVWIHFISSESMMHLFFGYGFPAYWIAKVFLYVCMKYCITASCDCKTHVPWSCFTIRQRLIQLSEVLTCVKEEATIQILV